MPTEEADAPAASEQGVYRMGSFCSGAGTNAHLALVLALRIIRAFLVEEAKIVKAVLASQKQKK